MAGSNRKSARGPAARSAIGTVNWATMRRTANTRPWRSGATLLCQIAWLLPLMIGTPTIIRKMPAATSGAYGRRPATKTATPRMRPKTSTP
jgi:hypothetical protein